jgi:glycosyltransferase involved in cell wall biosynthesis
MTEIKNIAIIWESETIGGVNSFLKYLLQSKPFTDKEITIFTNIENGGANLLIKDLKEQKNIKFIFFKSFFVFNRKRIFLEKLLYYFLKPILLLITYFRFIKILSNHKFDTLLCSCGNYGSFRSEQAAILAAEKLKIPVKSIIIHHACVKPPLFMSLIFKLIDYLLTKKLTSLITVSKATKETLIKNSNLLNNDRLESYVIHNGVPKNNYEKKNYLKLKKNDNKKLVLKIGMVSRLSPDKGHEDLINAFSKLTKEYKDKMDIIIIGKEERKQKRNLKNLILSVGLENKVEFLDYVDLDSKKIILSLDLFLSLTKKYEGFGLSIAEAMSVGTPVLATDVGAVTEFFDNECGKLIKPNQVEEIKEALMDFCDHKIEWENKAKIAKSRIEKNFNSEFMANNYMNHLSSKFYEIIS